MPATPGRKIACERYKARHPEMLRKAQKKYYEKNKLSIAIQHKKYHMYKKILIEMGNLTEI